MKRRESQMRMKSTENEAGQVAGSGKLVVSSEPSGQQRLLAKLCGEGGNLESRANGQAHATLRSERTGNALEDAEPARQED